MAPSNGNISSHLHLLHWVLKLVSISHHMYNLRKTSVLPPLQVACIDRSIRPSIRSSVRSSKFLFSLMFFF